MGGRTAISRVEFLEKWLNEEFRFGGECDSWAAMRSKERWKRLRSRIVRKMSG